MQIMILNNKFTATSASKCLLPSADDKQLLQFWRLVNQKTEFYVNIRVLHLQNFCQLLFHIYHLTNKFSLELLPFVSRKSDFWEYIGFELWYNYCPYFMYTEHSITKGFTAGVDISSSKLLGLYGRDIGSWWSNLDTTVSRRIAVNCCCCPRSHEPRQKKL